MTAIKLSIVIPIFNEIELLPTLLRRLVDTRALFVETFNLNEADIEILFVNDGSKDGSRLALLEYCRLNEGYICVDFSRNFCHENEISAGIFQARGDYVVVMDGDLQDPPEFIIDLYRKALEGFDVVYAVRKARKGESVFKKATAAVFYQLIKHLGEVDTPLNTGDFRIMSRAVVDVFNHMSERHRYIRGMISWVGFEQTGLLYDRDERFAGETKFSLLKMLHFAMDGIVSSSVLPLKFATFSGVIFTCVGVLYSIYVIYLKLFDPETVLGWSSMMIILLIGLGFQMLFFGLIGEYIGRIYEEIKGRQLYIIRDVVSKKPANES